MDKNEMNFIPLLIGVVNIIVVLISANYLTTTDQKIIPKLLYLVLDFYVKWSFVPAILSLVLTKIQVQSSISKVNYFINFTYLLVYGILFFVIRFAQMGI